MIQNGNVSYRLTFCFANVLLATTLCEPGVCAGGKAGTGDVYPKAHTDRFERPMVVQLTFSPDGKQLLAAFYRSASDRGGRHWRAFVAQWDLSTGKRMILWNAAAPIAVSPDKQTVAMAYYERWKEPRKRRWPKAQLALWRIGERMPFLVLGRPSTKPRPGLKKRGDLLEEDPLLPPLATVFTGDRQLVSVSAKGELSQWQLTTGNNAAAGIVLDGIKVNERGERWSWSWWQTGALSLDWQAKNKLLTLTAISLHRPPQKRRITWKLNLAAGKAERLDDKVSNLTVTRKEGPTPSYKLAKQVISPDGRFQAQPQEDGTIRIVDLHDKNVQAAKVLRLDD